ncbi:hypothetical protein SDC9_153066 [bioreactor metagenome]|uniref:Uncharacterized protein n=1 Tax=bioreactor metagenome TaxID=1076179 RepID=A0A645EZI1_9ZZZZ
MQALFFALHVIPGAPAHTVGAKRAPLGQNFAHAHHAGLPGNQHIKVARKAVLQRRHAKQARHQFVRVLPALEVHRQLQAAKVRLIAYITDFAYLAGLDQLGNFVHDGFHCGRWRDFADLNDIALFKILVLGTHPNTAAPGFANGTHFVFVVQNFAATHKIRRLQGGQNIMVFIPQQRNRSGAKLAQVKRTNIRCHAHRDAQRIVG